VTQDYEDKKRRSAAREESISRKGREIGGIPPVEDLERRYECSKSLLLHGQTYHSDLLYLETCEDQLEMIRSIERAVLQGDLQAIAMPRGSGKTTWCEVGCEWAILNGFHPFGVMIGATEPHAEEMLDSIKASLESNELLLADYPEAVYPIQCLEGIVNRCKGQLCNGERTAMEWTAKQIVFPTVTPPPEWNGPRRKDGKSLSSGSVIRIAGLTGRVRGMKHKGKRPSFVLIDDPQTRESAKSFEQSADRVKTLSGDVLGLAGPGKKICGLMPCTVIYPGDMADQILDRSKHPAWQGIRKKLVYSFPTNSGLWDQYADIRKNYSKDVEGDQARAHAEATEFYRNNREAMDAGAVVAWEGRYNSDEISALQSAMNLKIRDEGAFFAEYQNEPIEEKVDTVQPLSMDAIASRINRVPRGRVARGRNVLTAMIDVQKDYLFWGVGAFTSAGFSGDFVDYGLWPTTTRTYFRLSDGLPTLLQMYPNGSRENAWYQGLTDLMGELSTRVYLGEDGTEHKLDGGCIDSQYGESTESIYLAVSRSPHRKDWIPSHGKGIKPGQKRVTAWQDKPGDRKGLNWRIRLEGRGRHVLYDTNFWKSFLIERFRIPVGQPGAMLLFGDRQSTHRMLAEHLTSEAAKSVTVDGDTGNVWQLMPGRENHLLDIAVGLTMRASTLGCTTLTAAPEATKQKKRKYTYAEVMAERRAGA
jgi:hypothetical protein